MSSSRSSSKSSKLRNYLRTHRRRAGLSQTEIAYLFRHRSGSKISRYERGARLPGLMAALGFEAMFGVPVRELFGALYEQVERTVARRARFMLRRLQRADAGKRVSQKIAALAAITRTRRAPQKRASAHENSPNTRR